MRSRMNEFYFNPRFAFSRQIHYSQQRSMSARDEGADPPACALFTWRSMRRVQGLVYDHLKTKTEQTKTYDRKYSPVNVDLICFCCFLPVIIL